MNHIKLYNFGKLGEAKVIDISLNIDDKVQESSGSIVAVGAVAVLATYSEIVSAGATGVP